MWFKQDCWDDDRDELKPSKSKVPMPNVKDKFAGTVGLQVTYRKFPGSELLVSFTQKQKCYSEEDSKNLVLIVNGKIKNIYESISNCKGPEDIVNILDSLIIRRDQFVSVNLESTSNS